MSPSDTPQSVAKIMCERQVALLLPVVREWTTVRSSSLLGVRGTWRWVWVLNQRPARHRQSNACDSLGYFVADNVRHGTASLGIVAVAILPPEALSYRPMPNLPKTWGGLNGSTQHSVQTTFIENSLFYKKPPFLRASRVQRMYQFSQVSYLSL